MDRKKSRSYLNKFFRYAYILKESRVCVVYTKIKDLLFTNKLKFIYFILSSLKIKKESNRIV